MSSTGWLVTGCLTMMLLDIISGYSQAIANKCISSTALKNGILHKSALILLIVLAITCDIFVAHIPGLNLPLGISPVICSLVFFMELNSILENIIKLNPDLKEKSLFKLFGFKK